MKDEIRELTAADFVRAIPRRLRERLVRGKLRSGEDLIVSVGYGAAIFPAKATDA